MSELDVVKVENGKELVPNFWKANLTDQERELYEHLIDQLVFRNGAIFLSQPDADIFTDGERITLKEFQKRYRKYFGISVGPKIE